MLLNFEFNRFNIDYINQLLYKKSMKNEKIKIFSINPSKDYISTKSKAESNKIEDTYITYPIEYNKVIYTHFIRIGEEEGLEMINSDYEISN